MMSINVFLIAATQLFAPNAFKVYDHENRLTITAGKEFMGSPCLCVEGPDKRYNTAWRVVSDRVAVPEGDRSFLLRYDIFAEQYVFAVCAEEEGYNNAIFWYDGDGKKIAAYPIVFSVPRCDFSPIEVRGAVPDGAKFVAVQLGWDSPKLKPGDMYAFRNVVFETSRETSAEKVTAKVVKLNVRPDPPVPVREFKVDRLPETPKVTLRDDGVTLIDGKPFFPIGIYSIRKNESNGEDLDRAFRELKEAGFNFAHSYWHHRDDDFLAAARKYGFKMWHQARWPDQKLIDELRFNPDIIAWYIGDDTARYNPPWETMGFHRALKKIDPTRITCQADIVEGSMLNDHYRDYVNITDVYMPELYSVRGKAGDVTDKTCVAWTVKGMKDVWRDIRLYGDGRPKGCWPILQCFKGWGMWEHVPSREQIFATSFAAIALGANGITWYDYGGSEKSKREGFEGMKSTVKMFADMSELANWIKDLSPVLLERTPARQPIVDVTAGPARDAYDNDSVSVLLKRHGGYVYVIAVNSASEPVEAHITVPGAADGLGSVAREGRSVTLEHGGFTDRFAHLGFHVYRFSEGK